MTTEKRSGWCVEIIERERGWGPRLDETLFFGPDGADRERAEKFVREYNKRNNLPTVPDWYMQATTPEWFDNVPENATDMSRDRKILKETEV